MMAESAESRVQSMATDRGETWDLSPMDQLALKDVLGELRKLRADVVELKSLRAEVEPLREWLREIVRTPRGQIDAAAVHAAARDYLRAHPAGATPSEGDTTTEGDGHG